MRHPLLADYKLQQHHDSISINEAINGGSGFPAANKVPCQSANRGRKAAPTPTDLSMLTLE
jgi:hypothetical protein